MARPYNRWDPGVNADMIVPLSEGPLVISEGDARWPLFVRQAVDPVMFRNPEWIGYLQELLFEDGTPPATGARIRGYQYMPSDASFFGADPVNGEPRPDDASDTHESRNYRYANLGYRLPIRGLVGSVGDGLLNVDFQVKWGDPVTRTVAAIRGAWTGASLGVYNGATELADFLAYALHGKRLGDGSWEHRGSLVDSPISGYTPTTSVAGPWDGKNEGQVRVIITGGPPLWTVKTQYWDPGIPDWVDLSSTDVDLQQYEVPGSEDLFFLQPFLFHGATKNFPGSMPSPPPYQDTYFQEVSVSAFTPFVLDTADWSQREKEEKLEWHTGSDWWDAPLEMKTPALDIITWPEDTDQGPERTREFDNDEQLWGVRLRPTTKMVFQEIDDRRYLHVENYDGTYYIPAWLSDSEGVGETIPFAYVGRYKLIDLDTWPGERTLASFGPAGWGAAPGAGATGLGLTWRPNNDGELVLKYWDSVAPGWLELVVPLDASEYNNRLVDIALAWTGARGDTIGRPNSELRIVVDGVTLGTVIEENPNFQGGWQASIGSGDPSARESFVGIWFGGATFIEAVTDYEIQRAFVEDEEEGFDNPSFEVAHPSGRPGEADKWLWQSLQNIGGWADFSAYRADLAPYRYGREGFEGGWLLEQRRYTWTYADETERIAATGFTPDDIGKKALQADTNEIYVLLDDSPIEWGLVAYRENQHSVFDLADAEIAAGIFNAGIPNFEGPVEHFDIWGRVWDAMTWSGSPWLDAYNLIPPCEDNLGPYSGPTGFDGWYDHLYGTNLDPLCRESFDEAWGNDPLSTSGGQRWIPSAAPGGVLSGAPIEFPLVIPPNLNQLIITSDMFGAVILKLDNLEFADIATLASELNSKLSLLVPPLAGLQFGYWQRNEEEGLTFGWNGLPSAAVSVAFATLESAMFRDLREPLGLRSFSPGGNYTGVGIPVWTYPSPPSGMESDDRVLMDSWSLVEFLIITDPVLGDWVIEYGMIGAIFDSAVPEPTLLERFTLKGWVNPSAVWIPDLSAVSLDQAMFNGGSDALELFVDTNWPDEPFPT